MGFFWQSQIIFQNIPCFWSIQIITLNLLLVIHEKASLLPELLYGVRLKPQYWKMLPVFPKLFLMTHVLKSLCLGDKRTTVVRRDVQCITQVYPGRPQALICNSVSALFSTTNMDTDGCVSCSRLLTGPIKTWKTKAFITQSWPQSLQYC